MFIDFGPLQRREVQIHDFEKGFTLEQMPATINVYYDRVLEIIGDASDEELVFEPVDEKADDPYAKTEAEKEISWNAAHIVLHMTASLEEGAGFASLLGRGVELPEGIRVRYEPDWKTYTTRAQVMQRLTESRRMVLSLLNSMPDEPITDNFRKFSMRSSQVQISALGSVLFGLSHFDGHLAQLQDALKQAYTAVNAAG
jgi:hypothetical protein